MAATSQLKRRLEAVRSDFELADVGFLVLRVVAPLGLFLWLPLAHVPRESFGTFFGIAGYFVAYSLLLYVVLFIDPSLKKVVYALSLLLDLSFVFLLIANTGGYESSWFVGLYLLAALHAFYYGPIAGLAAAAVCAGTYYVAGVRISSIAPADFLLRAAFLFIIAFPIGLLSGVLRGDKKKIESLNRNLRNGIDAMDQLQGKLLDAEKFTALGRLTADVAHEIRNPLTVIGGFAKRLEKRLPEDMKEREYARIVVAEVTRLERILRDTLNFSREVKLHFAHAGVNDILRQIEADYAGMCREKGIALSVRPDPDVPSCVVDVDHIRQAIANLVTNAVDATGAGGTVTLSSGSSCENGVHSVVVTVADTGPGIPEAVVKRIFEPFFSTKETGRGTGLGLTICKKIMEEHRGVIRVSTVPGRGSAFTLHIPYLPANDAFRAQCWEYMRCGVEKVENAAERCSAYPNFGRICWSVAGTFSETKLQGIVAHKVGDCRKCPFFLAVQPTACNSPA